MRYPGAPAPPLRLHGPRPSETAPTRGSCRSAGRRPLDRPHAGHRIWSTRSLRSPHVGSGGGGQQAPQAPHSRPARSKQPASMRSKAMPRTPNFHDARNGPSSVPGARIRARRRQPTPLEARVSQPPRAVQLCHDCSAGNMAWNNASRQRTGRTPSGRDTTEPEDGRRSVQRPLSRPAARISTSDPCPHGPSALGRARPCRAVGGPRRRA
jgi:hypothetical protein